MDWQQIREERLKRGLSQAELASKVGLTQGAISQLERGLSRQSLAIRRIQQVLESRDDEPRAPSSSPVRYEWPEPGGITTLRVAGKRVRLETWLRGAEGGPFGGDLCVAGSLPDGSALVVVADLAGHGQAMIPARFWFEGWWSAYLKNQVSAPRLDHVIRQASLALMEKNLAASVLLILLDPIGWDEDEARIEVLSCGFPVPMLFQGQGEDKVHPLGALCPGLPLLDESVSLIPAEGKLLTPPWRLVAASDGLLQRLGQDDPGGRRVIRQWLSGPERELAPRTFFERGAPIDDELFMHLGYDDWDDQAKCQARDAAAVDRFLRALSTNGVARVDALALERFVDAVREAILNVRQHAYMGGDGPLNLRMRFEAERLRVEVEDASPHGIAAGAVEGSDSGFLVMKRFADSVSVRAARDKGNIVTLILEHKG